MLSIQFNLLLAKIITLLSFFFLFLVVFDYFFASPVDNEHARLRLALTIPTGVPITCKDAIEMLPLVADKTIKTYRNNQKKQYTC